MFLHPSLLRVYVGADRKSEDQLQREERAKHDVRIRMSNVVTRGDHAAKW
jgi:hypothetical protein